MSRDEDASSRPVDASLAAGRAANGAADAGPTLPPELWGKIFRFLWGRNRTLVNCALVSRTMRDLALAVVYTRLYNEEVTVPSFFAGARTNAGFVRELYLYGGVDNVSRIVTCLAFFGNLRSLELEVAGGADPDDLLFELIPGLKNLEYLHVHYGSKSANRSPRIDLPAGIKHVSLFFARFPADPAAFAAALEPLKRLETFEFDTWGTSKESFEPLLPLSHVWSALKHFELPADELTHAERLFRLPCFRPETIGIDFPVPDGPVSVPGSLSCLQGLGRFELSDWTTASLAECDLPPCGVLALYSFRASLATDRLAGFEAMLRRKSSEIRVSDLRLSGRDEDAAEVAMWKRLCRWGVGIADGGVV
ncbi:hypothetical protein DFJ74DRAFT_697761 [Hyaloraphidium curvatum]|nr:hypothetical protein DFJ74DRAFT_697761 [Hyaloraphidium curvatum]